MTGHIHPTFDQELDRLHHDVLTMASIARKNLVAAMRGLLDRNTDLCNAAIAADHDVNELEQNIDRLGMQVLLKYQPTARDLRQVMAAIRIANNLERISDQAGGIAKRARQINNLPEMLELNLIEPVYVLCARNLELSLKAFAEGDVEAAAATRLLDKELDEAEKEFDQRLLAVMQSQKGSLEGYLHLIFAARFLERVGDHAKNICEDTIFIEKAEDVRFDKSKRQQATASEIPVDGAVGAPGPPRQSYRR